MTASFFFCISFLSTLESKALISILYSIDKQIAHLSSTKFRPMPGFVRFMIDESSGFFSKRISDFYANFTTSGALCSMNSFNLWTEICSLPDMESQNYYFLFFSAMTISIWFFRIISGKFMNDQNVKPNIAWKIIIFNKKNFTPYIFAVGKSLKYEAYTKIIMNYCCSIWYTIDGELKLCAIYWAHRDCGRCEKSQYLYLHSNNNIDSTSVSLSFVISEFYVKCGFFGSFHQPNAMYIWLHP